VDPRGQRAVGTPRDDRRRTANTSAPPEAGPTTVTAQRAGGRTTRAEADVERPTPAPTWADDADGRTRPTPAQPTAPRARAARRPWRHHERQPAAARRGDAARSTAAGVPAHRGRAASSATRPAGHPAAGSWPAARGGLPIPGGHSRPVRPTDPGGTVDRTSASTATDDEMRRFG